VRNAHATPAPSPFSSPRLDVKHAKLDNGLRVVMVVDHTMPTVAVDVAYGVGSRNEQRGRTGYAHLFEHMMFQGSRNVAAGEHRRLVISRGGVLDGAAAPDLTSFYELLPASELALGLWLEADRMKSLDVSAASLDTQRALVRQEYRRAVENAPYGLAWLRLNQLVFQGFWPYEHSSMGTPRDLEGAQLEGVRTFYETYYAPNNAVVAIAGDIDEGDCLALVRRYFGDAAARANLPPFDAAAPPEQTAPRSAIVEDPHAKVAAILAGWLAPPSGEPDHYALEVVAMLLSDGDVSRLQRSLLGPRGIATSASASVNGLHGPDLFEVDVRLAGGAHPDQALKLIEAQLADLGRNGPSDDEMRVVKSRIRARFLFRLQSNAARATMLAELELSRGDASIVNTELDKYLAVTKEDVKRTTAKYLSSTHRNTVEVKPGEKS
jgi:predicted Zn-dependent peptidase